MRLLFVLPTTALMGGVKVVFELAERLAAGGDTAHVFSFAGPPRWQAPRATLLPARDLGDVRFADYDVVLACNAFLLPVLLPRVAPARLVFFCQDYESFHHAAEPSFESFLAEVPEFVELYRLPVPIIATSRAVQTLIRERAGVAAWHVPVAIDAAVFRPQPRPAPSDRRRVLFVGNYLMPYKGIADGIAALRALAGALPLTLVLVTQETRGRHLFADLPFPVEIHLRPSEPHMPGIYAGCDLYCCASWYEGLGLPALEAFACGTPVVSTRTFGVSDYGADGANLLLANPHDPADLADKIRRALTDAGLVERLRRGGFRTVAARPDWIAAVAACRQALADIERLPPAERVDDGMLAALQARLEAAGHVTPIDVVREFDRLAARLDALCRSLAASPTAAALADLRAVRDALRRRLANPRAEYYGAYKAKYDLCQLLLAFADSDALADYAALLIDRDRTRGPEPAAAFSEIRYPLA